MTKTTIERALLVCGCVWMLAGCASNHRVGAEPDAAPPGRDECNAMFDALPRACESDDDCALAVQTECFYYGSGRGHARGISRDALTQFDALAQTCDLPRLENARERCPGEGGGLARVFTDDQELIEPGAPMLVRCDSGRCATLRTSCGPTLCDNGMLDACRYSTSEDGAQLAVVTDPSDPTARHEACDGADLSGATCESLGYGGGTLSCRPYACVLDVSACSPCVATGDVPDACADDIAVNTTGRAVLAASATEVAVAWSEDVGGDSITRFARFDQNLTLLSQITVPTLPTAPPTLASPRSLVATADGWMLATTQSALEDAAWSPSVSVHVIDAAGAYVGGHDVSPPSTGDPSITVQLVPGPHATPLLLLGTRQSTAPRAQAHALTAAGSLAGDMIDLGAGAPFDGVFVGDGYLVVVVDSAGALMQRVELDGSIRAAPVNHGALPGPSLVRDAQHTLLVSGDGVSTRLTRLGSDGARSPDEEDTTIDASGTFVALDGAEMLVTGREETVITRVALDGSVGASSTIARQPDGYLDAVVAQGDHAFVLISGTEAFAPHYSARTRTLVRVSP